MTEDNVYYLKPKTLNPDLEKGFDLIAPALAQTYDECGPNVTVSLLAYMLCKAIVFNTKDPINVFTQVLNAMKQNLNQGNKLDGREIGDMEIVIGEGTYYV